MIHQPIPRRPQISGATRQGAIPPGRRTRPKEVYTPDECVGKREPRDPRRGPAKKQKRVDIHPMGLSAPSGKAVEFGP